MKFHPYHQKTRQLRILETGTREQIIEWLAWNDGNGCYTDSDRRNEGCEPLTLEQCREIMIGQIEE